MIDFNSKSSDSPVTNILLISIMYIFGDLGLVFLAFSMKSLLAPPSKFLSFDKMFLLNKYELFGSVLKNQAGVSTWTFCDFETKKFH